MIQIEILSSSEKLQGEWRWGGNYLVLGGKGIPLSEFELGALEVGTQGLTFLPFPSLEYFLLNEKRSTLPRILKPEDIIQLGDTKIKIIGSYETQFMNKNEELKSKLNTLKSSHDPLLEVINLMTKNSL